MAERYANKDEYVARVTAAARALVARGLLLEEDIATYTAKAKAQTMFQ